MDTVSELEALIKAFNPSKNRRYSKYTDVRVHRRISLFDRGILTSIYAVAWSPSVTGRGRVDDPFAWSIESRLVTTIWMTEAHELVVHWDDKFVIRELRDLPEYSREELLLGLHGEFAALDRRLDEERKAFAEHLADTVIREANDQVRKQVHLTPLQQLGGKVAVFDKDAPDFRTRRQEIIQALLA